MSRDRHARQAAAESTLAVDNGDSVPLSPPLSDKKPPKTKRERFLSLAPVRTRKTIKALDNLSNCFGRAGYEWTDAERLKIRDAVHAAVLALERRMDGAAQTRSEFTL